MPLTSGSSSKTKSKNIGEMIKSYKKTGKIGSSKPNSMKKAKEQASAIAYSKAKEESTEDTKKESFDEKINSYLKKYIFEKKLKEEDAEGLSPQDQQKAVKQKQDEINALKKASNPNSPEAKAIAAVGGIKDKNKKPTLTSTL